MKPALPKKIMRALPTLTEVVDASKQQAASAALASADLDEAVLVERILRQIEPRLEAQVEVQLQKAISELVHEQVQLLQTRIRAKVDAAVRKAVTQAVSEELQGPAGGAKS